MELAFSTFYAYRGVEPNFWVLFPGTKKGQVLGFFLRLLGLGSLKLFCYAFLFILLSPHSPHVGHTIYDGYMCCALL